MTRQVKPHPKAPEFMNVFEGDELIGWVGRDEELGMIEWMAYTTDDRCIGRFHGRGSRQKAISAVFREAEL